MGGIVSTEFAFVGSDGIRCARRRPAQRPLGWPGSFRQKLGADKNPHTRQRVCDKSVASSGGARPGSPVVLELSAELVAAEGGFDRLEVESPGAAAGLDQDADEAVDLAFDGCADRVRRFFSSTVLSASAGRALQSFSFTSSSSALSLRKRWNSSTSARAFRSAAGEGNVSVTDFPSIFLVRR